MDYNHHLSYSLRRAEEIHQFKTESDKRFTFNRFINLKRNGDPALLIPEPKKAEIII